MRTSISAVVISMSLLLAPAAAFAQQHRGPSHGPVHIQKPGFQKHGMKKTVVVKQHRWARGRALPSNYRRNYVTDYRRYNLRAPGRGQRWVRVDNQYILINSISGMIAALIAAR